MGNADTLRLSQRVQRIVLKTSLMAAVVAALACSIVAPTRADQMYGGFGPEGARMREQLWLLPSGDEKTPLRATVFRPDDSDGSVAHRLVVINHGTDDATRLAVSMPVYYWLSRWFVERGYVVVLPQRRGHGATGGPLAESVGTCETADHLASGQIAADDIAATISYMTRQPFVVAKDAVVVGISTGGWASLAIASRNLPQVGRIVNFAGGRGGHAYGKDNAVCNEAGLLSAAKAMGHDARAPTMWLYSRNDSYFSPELATEMATEWTAGGGQAVVRILPAYRQDGHSLADDRGGWDLWGEYLDAFLKAKPMDQDIPAGALTSSLGLDGEPAVPDGAVR